MQFKSPIWQIGGHMQTVLPSLFRKVRGVNYTRERITLPDSDFLDLDWAQAVPCSDTLVIVTHGLEGDSSRHYVMGMVKALKSKNVDALAWNCRSCSGELNALPRFYHHGDASDIRFLIELALKRGYRKVGLVGFSMGGSLSLRAIGQYLPDAAVKACAVFSVPLDLPSSVRELYKPGKRFYMHRFLKKLGKKIKAKAAIYPDLISYEGYEDIKNFDQFDSRYTAPLHGYASAADFYAKASVKPLLPNISIPTLIGQAKNDPFMTPQCLEPGCNNPFIRFECYENGGHVGFEQASTAVSFAEGRVLAFFKEVGLIEP